MKGRDRTAGPSRLLTLEDAEVEYGIPAWTIRDLIAKGELAEVRPPGLRRRWVRRADLDAAIEAWTSKRSG
jgi:excisionase family DNA binding protein